MNTLILESKNYSELALSVYKKFGNVYLGLDSCDSFDDVNILVVRLNYKIDEIFLRQFKALKIIISPTTGSAHIDEGYCISNGIEVICLKDNISAIRHITSTAEHAVGLILALHKRLILANSSVVHEGRWDRDLFVTKQLSSMSLGVIGFGRIGRMVAKYLSPIFRVVYVNDIKKISLSDECKNIEIVDLNTLLKKSDVITLHVSLNKLNHKMISNKELALIKPEAILVNTARGELVDERSVASLIQANKMGGYATDVLDNEQSAVLHLLERHSLTHLAREGHNIIITPHIGGACSDAMRYTEELVARELSNRFF